MDQEVHGQSCIQEVAREGPAVEIRGQSAATYGGVEFPGDLR
jgi:hypothetical protein